MQTERAASPLYRLSTTGSVVATAYSNSIIPCIGAYSRQRQCIGGSPNIVVPTSIDPSFVGFVDEQELEATLKVKWSTPAQREIG